MLFLSLFASSFRAVPDSNKVSLPSWLFWVLLLVVVALVAGLLIRDKALRDKVAAGLNNLKKKWIRARLRGKIKKGQRTLDEALKRLGQAAWTAGHRPEASAEAVRELSVLHETIQAKKDEIAKIEAEAAETKQLQAEFSKSQKARIDKQVEAAQPHRDELSARQARLKEVALALDDAEKIVTGADSEIRTAEKASIMEAAAKVQAIIDGYDKAIKGLGDELSEKIRTSEAHVAEMEKRKSSLKAEIDEIDRKKQPHWAALGKTLNEKRVNDPALASIYAEIDGIDKAIRENEARHKDLGGS